MRLVFFLVFLVGCTINVPEPKGEVQPVDGSEESDQSDSPVAPDDEVADTGGTDPAPKIPDRPEPQKPQTTAPDLENRGSRSVCESALPPGMMDVAIQKEGHFYETAAKLVLESRTKTSSDEDTAQRLMYGDSMRMWVRVPELIRTVKGRGSAEAELCLTVGNVNCRYIWGAKVYELDFCDFGVQPDDILGARFFSLEVHNSDIAPDAQVRAELEAVSPVR